MQILSGWFLAFLHLLFVRVLVSSSIQGNVLEHFLALYSPDSKAYGDHKTEIFNEGYYKNKDFLNRPPTIKAVDNNADTITMDQNYNYGSLQYICKLNRVNPSRNDFLSWYQIKGRDHILLRTRKFIGDAKIMQLNLNKVLQLSDNDTELYCAKQTKLPEGRILNGIQTNKTLLRFREEDIKHNEPSHIFVTVTPNTSPVSFSLNERLSFVCNGTTPAGEMTLKWYIQGLETKLAEKQFLNITEYTNNLELLMDESYHQKQLFCTQALQYYNLQNDGSFGEVKYKEVAKSKMIILQQKGKEANTGKPEYDTRTEPPQRVLSPDDNIKQGHTGSAKFIVTLTLLTILSVSTILLILLVTVWFRFHRKKTSLVKKNDEEDIYTTPQVTYAELDLQSNNTKYATTPGGDNSPYAKVVGVLKPTRQ